MSDVPPFSRWPQAGDLHRHGQAFLGAILIPQQQGQRLVAGGGRPDVFHPGGHLRAGSRQRAHSVASRRNAAATAVSPVERSLMIRVAKYGGQRQILDADQETKYQQMAILRVHLPSMILNRFVLAIPRRIPQARRLTLVLDLDETLAHCMSDSEAAILGPDTRVEIVVAGVSYLYPMKWRPGLAELLEHIKGRFEVILFTAAERPYAEKVLAAMDPSGQCFEHVLCREQCLDAGGCILKDLSTLGRDLARTVIVDNTPQTFSLQLNNGIPILSWKSDPYDRELFKIISLLSRLDAADDVRPILRKKFQIELKVLAAMPSRQAR